MNPAERDKLFFLKKQKEISNAELARHLECSASLISKFFKHKANMSGKKERKMKEYIRNKNHNVWVNISLK